MNLQAKSFLPRCADNFLSSLEIRPPVEGRLKRGKAPERRTFKGETPATHVFERNLSNSVGNTVRFRGSPMRFLSLVVADVNNFPLYVVGFDFTRQ